MIACTKGLHHSLFFNKCLLYELMNMVIFIPTVRAKNYENIEASNSQI